MRNINTKGKISHQQKGNIPRLEIIHTLIDANNFDMELVFEKLYQINTRFLKPYHLVYYHYLTARFHFNCYKQENAIEHLELASDLLDTMDVIAYQNKIKIKKESYHFTRAYIKFLLAKISFDDYSAPFQLAKATRITEIALGFNPQNSSFLWLQKQLLN